MYTSDCGDGEPSGVDPASLTPDGVVMTDPPPEKEHTTPDTMSSTVGSMPACSSGSVVPNFIGGSVPMQGTGWFQNSRPELVTWRVAVGTDYHQCVRVFFAANKFVDFESADGTTDSLFVGVNGEQGVVVRTDAIGSTPELFTYYDNRGMVYTFFGTSSVWGSNYGAKGQLWRIQNQDGNAGCDTFYTGNATDPAAALTSGFYPESSTDSTPSARCHFAYSPSGRTWEYSYTDLTGYGTVLSQIKIKDSSNAVVWTMDYVYYGQSEADDASQLGNLKFTTETKPLSSGSIANETRTNYFRYYERGLLKLQLDPEGYRRATAALGNVDASSVTDNDLIPYVKVMYTYRSDEQVPPHLTSRVSTVIAPTSGCGCGGSGARGYYVFKSYYEQNFTGGYDRNASAQDAQWGITRWKYRTEFVAPDGTWHARYSDEFGQVLAKVVSNEQNPDATNAFDPTQPNRKLWIWKYERDGFGRIATIYYPDAINAATFNHTTGKIDVEAGSGVVRHFEYSTSDYLHTALTAVKVSNGSGGPQTTLETWTYVDPATGGAGKVFTDPSNSSLTVRIAKPLVASHSVYRDASTIDTTSYSYSFYSGVSSWAPKSRTATLPGLSTGDSSGPSTVTTTDYLDPLGRVVLSKDGAGRFSYTKYDAAGEVVKSVEDASSLDSDASSAAGSFGISFPTGALCYATAFAYDGQGRVASMTLPSGRVMPRYHGALNDGRLVELSIPSLSSGTYSGPVSYVVRNLAGKIEATGTIAINSGGTASPPSAWISASGDVISAVSSAPGTLNHLVANEYDTLGTQLQETRQFFSMPTTYASAVPGTHYDVNSYTYDAMGRVVQTTDPTGTIQASALDARGRVYERFVGTSTAAQLVETIVYDHDGAGNGWVTSKTVKPTSNSSDDRTTTYLRDWRGRLSVQQNPTAPHIVFKVDDSGRVLAVGEYTAAPSNGTDPTGSTGSGRVALAETLYNSRGQVRATIRHKINQGSGSIEDGIESDRWYDGAGRLIKTSGESLTKTFYDGLGRVTNQFTLASTDDSSYSDATNVSGDKVLEEDQTFYDDSSRTGDVLMSVRIDRHPNDTSTTGPLDAAGDGLGVIASGSSSVHGRAQITSYYYDALDRETASVELGTNGDSSYTRASDGGLSTPGSSSPTRLVSSSAYNLDGTVAYTTDPRGKSTVYDYDDAGRQTQTIANYINGVAGNDGGDDDQAISYGYSNGLLHTMTAHLAGGGSQTTTYSYGVTNSGTLPSTLISNRLLHTVAYPDNSGSSDVVTYAYNNLGEQTGMIDQAGNQIATTYDPAGRMLSKAVSNLASGFDGSVRRIEMAYLDGRGLITQVTQYDAASGGNVTDQVAYGYDGWGNLTGFYQDPDSAMSSPGVSTTTGTGNRGAWGVIYTYAAHAGASGGRDTLRRTAQYLQAQGSTFYQVGYSYGSGINDLTSRVASVTTGASPTTVASYDYLGADTLVGTTLDQAQLNTSVFDASSGIAYPDLDQFNRPLRWNWERIGGASGGLYDTSIAYDNNSNPTSTIDNVHIRQTTSKHLFDVVYGIDGLNRVTQADEGNATGSPLAIQSGTHTRNELWNNLSLTGNWGHRKLDANGDGSFTGADDLDETSNTFNPVNEWTARHVAKTGSDYDDHAYTYDAVGNLTAESFTTHRGSTIGNASRGFVYDAFGRLTAVTGAASEDGPTYIAKYRYNGLGFRILSQEDDNANSTLDDAERRFMMYDERWRVVATFRTNDESPKEAYAFHAAGWNGSGDASYIDSVILRDRDNTSCGTGCDARLHQSDGVLEERRFYCQNWRADVVAITAADGTPIEYVRYSAYGEPTVYPLADINMDGVVDSTDMSQWEDVNAGGTPAMAYASGDIDFDGYFGSGGASADGDEFADSYAANLGLSGKGRLSSPGVDNRIGYAGYQWDQALRGNHVRYRVYLPEIGRWTRRDPWGYVDGSSLYQYLGSQPVTFLDPTGRVLWIDFDIPIGTKRTKLEDSSRRVRQRLRDVIAALKADYENLSSCERKIMKSDFDEMISNFEIIGASLRLPSDPDDTGKTSQTNIYLKEGYIPDDPDWGKIDGHTKTYPSGGCTTTLNTKSDVNWDDLDQDELDRLILHEASHSREGYFSGDYDKLGINFRNPTIIDHVNSKNASHWDPYTRMKNSAKQECRKKKNQKPIEIYPNTKPGSWSPWDPLGG